MAKVGALQLLTNFVKEERKSNEVEDRTMGEERRRGGKKRKESPLN